MNISIILFLSTIVKQIFMKKQDIKQEKTICAVICEYNPFHNGHRRQLEEIRARAGCDFILCLMSGNFVQRGEAAILDKHTRAAHAILGGADAVLELPAPFAAANAEMFAGGAMNILSRIPAVRKLAFGCECGDAEDFAAAARLSLEEPPAFKETLRRELDGGQSFAKARFAALKAGMPFADERLFSAPNNMLGIEYAKAILRAGADMELLPLRRAGAGYADGELYENLSSASAIRNAVYAGGMSEKIQKNVPDFVFESLPAALDASAAEKLDAMEYHALVAAPAERVAAAPDCSEGLEHRLQNLTEECFTAADIVQKATSRRYTAARLRRILLSLTLGCTRSDQRIFLSVPLYCSVLAVNDAAADEMLGLLSRSGLPLLTRKGDADKLNGEAARCFALTERADKIYRALCRRPLNGCTARFVRR